MYLTESTGYLEGWATYVEHYSMKYFTGRGSTNSMLIAKDASIIGNLVLTRVEYGVNYENWSLEDSLNYIEPFGLFDMEKTQELFILFYTDPGYFAKYGMGYLWTQTIMDNLHANHPNATDKDIHTAYLNALTGTFEQIEQYADKQLN